MGCSHYARKRGIEKAPGSHHKVLCIPSTLAGGGRTLLQSAKTCQQLKSGGGKWSAR